MITTRSPESQALERILKSSTRNFVKTKMMKSALNYPLPHKLLTCPLLGNKLTNSHRSFPSIKSYPKAGTREKKKSLARPQLVFLLKKSVGVARERSGKFISKPLPRKLMTFVRNSRMPSKARCLLKRDKSLETKFQLNNQDWRKSTRSSTYMILYRRKMISWISWKISLQKHWRTNQKYFLS